MKRRRPEPEVANAPLKLTAVFKARKADSAAPKLEPEPPPPISVVVRLLGVTNKSSSSLMVEPLIAATQIVDRMQQPDPSPEVEQALSLLLDHYDSRGFAALGGKRSEVRREWIWPLSGRCLAAVWHGSKLVRTRPHRSGRRRS